MKRTIVEMTWNVTLRKKVVVEAETDEEAVRQAKTLPLTLEHQIELLDPELAEAYVVGHQ